jgi:hypothetical protein
MECVLNYSIKNLDQIWREHHIWPHVCNCNVRFPPKKDNEADDTNILISQSDKISIEIKNRPPTLNPNC